MHAVVRLDRLRRVAAGAIDGRIQNLHDGKPATGERLDDFLSREGEHAKHDAPHVAERDVAETGPYGGGGGVGIKNHRLRRGEENRLLVGHVQCCPPRLDEPMAADDRVVDVGL